MGAAAMEVGHPEGFHHVDTLSLKVPFQYKLLGYELELLDTFPDYQPPLLDQPLLLGAPEETRHRLGTQRRPLNVGGQPCRGPCGRSYPPRHL